MSASPLIKDDEPISEEELLTGPAAAEADVEFEWLDEQPIEASNTRNSATLAEKPAEEDDEFVEIDMDPVPTLFDVVEQTISFSPDDIQDDVTSVESVFEPASEAIRDSEQPNPELSMEIEFDADMQVDAVVDTNVDTANDIETNASAEDESAVIASLFEPANEAEPQLEQTSSELSVDIEFEADAQTVAVAETDMHPDLAAAIAIDADSEAEVAAFDSVFEPADEVAQLEQPDSELSVEIEFEADTRTDSAAKTDVDASTDAVIEDEVTVFDSVFEPANEVEPKLEQTSSELSIEFGFDAPVQAKTDIDADESTVADIDADTDGDTQEVELSGDMLAMANAAETEVAAEVQAKADVPEVDPRHISDATYEDHYDAANQPPVPSLENVFNLASYKPVQLQRMLMGVAFTFLFIAGAALWRAVDGRVITSELVPPMVYASIGVVAYLLGMRYLRIHFAQARVSDKDWLLCEQVMVAADNGVMLKARFGTAYLVWDQLLGVAHDSDYYYLLIEPTQGFKVPKKGVSDPSLQVKLDDMASLTRAKAWEY